MICGGCKKYSFEIYRMFFVQHHAAYFDTVKTTGQNLPSFEKINELFKYLLLTV